MKSSLGIQPWCHQVMAAESKVPGLKDRWAISPFDGRPSALPVIVGR